MANKLTGKAMMTGLIGGGLALTMAGSGVAGALVDPSVAEIEADSTAQEATSRPTRRHRPNLEALAEVLGMEADALGTALKDGQSLADIAAAQGVSTDDLRQAMLDGHAARIAAALDEGRIDQERADKMTERLTENIDGIISGEITPGRDREARPGRARRGENLEEMATLLGVDADALKESLKSGESLSDIAAANGIDSEVVVDAIVDRQTERLAAGVESGKITEEEAARIAENIEERASDIASGERPARAGRRGGRGAQAPTPAESN